MKYLGLDLGSKTLGIAISDELGFLARVYDTLRFKDNDYAYAIKKLEEICIKEGIKGIILGYPKHMNGDAGIRAKISEDFKAELELHCKVEVILWDERLSSVTVNKAMIEGNVRREKRKEKKDELAAVVILQNYLDYKKF